MTASAAFMARSARASKTCATEATSTPALLAVAANVLAKKRLANFYVRLQATMMSMVSTFEACMRWAPKTMCQVGYKPEGLLKHRQNCLSCICQGVAATTSVLYRLSML